jgi:hypothetical protein
MSSSGSLTAICEPFLASSYIDRIHRIAQPGYVTAAIMEPILRDEVIAHRREKADGKLDLSIGTPVEDG